jgi:hypothetical protein
LESSWFDKARRQASQFNAIVILLTLRSTTISPTHLHRWSVSLGISLIRFGVDDILNTTELIDSAILTTIELVFSTADYGFTFSYARKLPVPGFQYGVNAKIIRRVIGKLPIPMDLIWRRLLQFEKMIVLV